MTWSTVGTRVNAAPQCWETDLFSVERPEWLFLWAQAERRGYSIERWESLTWHCWPRPLRAWWPGYSGTQSLSVDEPEGSCIWTHKLFFVIPAKFCARKKRARAAWARRIPTVCLSTRRSKRRASRPSFRRPVSSLDRYAFFNSCADSFITMLAIFTLPILLICTASKHYLGPHDKRLQSVFTTQGPLSHRIVIQAASYSDWSVIRNWCA